jgi:hypothetical protein
VIVAGGVEREALLGDAAEVEVGGEDRLLLASRTGDDGAVRAITALPPLRTSACGSAASEDTGSSSGGRSLALMIAPQATTKHRPSNA